VARDVNDAYADRYTALGITPPPPSKVCRGQCEGTGWVPVYLAKGDRRFVIGQPDWLVSDDETDPELVERWEQAEAERRADDGWHFVKCPTCDGTGRR
jgi:hypothetical protein